MRPKTLLVLTLLALGLGAFIALYEKDLPSTTERTEREKKILDFEAEDLASLELRWTLDGMEHIARLERRALDLPENTEAGDGSTAQSPLPSRWYLTEPLEARADTAAADALAGRLANLETRRALAGEDVADRAELGLEPPRGSIVLQVNDPNDGESLGETVLEIGAEVPGTQDMLVAVSGSASTAGNAAFHLVEATLWTEISRQLDTWRDRDLFLGQRSGIDRVHLASAAGEVSLARRGEGFWLESPVVDQADTERMNTLLNHLTGLQARAFVDTTPGDLEAAGLDPPRARIEVLEASRADVFVLELGNPIPDAPGRLLAQVGGQLVEIDDELDATLALEPTAWRSRAWTETQVYRIDRAELRDAKGSLSLAREAGDWLRNGEKIPFAAASDVLYAVAEARAEEVVERQEALDRGFDLEEPEIEIILETEEGNETLKLFGLGTDRAVATAENRQALLLLAPGSTATLREALAAARSATSEPMTDEDG